MNVRSNLLRLNASRSTTANTPYTKVIVQNRLPATIHARRDVECVVEGAVRSGGDEVVEVIVVS
jgi:hypothetical protein